jgi:ribosome-associated toxin RatA of RatAB toxin-antitoxin module
MMHARRSVDIRAEAGAVYAMAQDVARWPKMLPHYRWVTVLRESSGMRVVEMAARRGVIPVRWTALQTLDPATPRIGFEHLSGWTRGMRVSWIFERLDDGTRVTIVHDLDGSRGALRDWFESRVVGDFFIQSIAGKTLARMKELAEAAHG